VFEQKRQIDETEFGHPVGEVARRLIAERHLAVFDQGEDLLGAMAVIHDVPHVVEGDAVAELRRERVADQFERTRE
jgi:hypothetical protein